MGTSQPRGLVGQRFQRWRAKPDNGPEVDDWVKKRLAEGCNKQKAIAEFRVSFAKKLKEGISAKGKKWEKTYSKIDRQKGKMKIFSRLVEDMGFFYDPQGAIRRATKCSR